MSVFVLFCALLNVNDYFQSDVDRMIHGIVIRMNNRHLEPISVFVPRKRDAYKVKLLTFVLC